ncbi:LysR family transcriptional regulator [Acinetobacter sp.]|uniref:LysR family transcriptional regulator n=1 Tax=Acinetobacter sp. TaxID=472 RepID=UPI0035B39D8C
MINIGRLRLLYELSILGSITAVAKAVHLTRPAVSQQLSLLEQELDVVLLQKVGRNVELTPIALSLANRYPELYSIINNIESDLALTKEDKVGQIRISLFASAAIGIMPLCASLISKKYPLIELKINELEPDDGLKAVVANQVDIALVDNMVDLKSFSMTLDFIPLCTDYFNVIASSQHFLANHKIVNLKDLSNEKWVFNQHAINYNTYINNAFLAAGFKPNIIGNYKNSTASLELIKYNLALSILPFLSINHLSNDSNFTLVRIKPLMSRQIFIAVPKGRSKQPAINAIIQTLQESVPNKLRRLDNSNIL